MIRAVYFTLAFLPVAFFVAKAVAAIPFEAWLSQMRRDALAEGVSERTVNQALSGIRSVPRIIELDRKQPEGRMSFAEYKQKVLNRDRIEQGRRLYRQHAVLLDRVAEKYDVPAAYVVALWGLETSYGNYTGGFGVIEALATLAHDGRRSDFFRRELINALKILDEGHISFDDMKGSWAGAMGQNQFMPSSFNHYAVDGNNDGRRDIWRSLPDVFSSSANYLARHGWQGDERWGRAIRLPAGFDESLADLDIERPLADWRAMGITMTNGQPIPVVEGMKGSIIVPDGINGPAYLVYDNFRVIMEWNKSVYFATTVGLLADAIR